MPTITEVANLATQSLAINDSTVLAMRWASDRFQELASRVPLKPLREIYELVIPATVRDGTIAITQGTTLVTGNAAATAVWTNDIVGRYIQIAQYWHEILGFDGTLGTLRLKSAFVGSTVTASSYIIAQRHTILKPRVRFLGAFANMNQRIPIRQTSLDAIDVSAPSRETVAGGPWAVTEISIDDEGFRKMEFYPYHDKLTLVHWSGYRYPPKLEPDAEIPSYIDAFDLVEGVKMNIMQRQMASTLHAATQDALGRSVAEVWRNDYRTQQTIWNRIRGEMAKKAEGIDDATFILAHAGGQQLPLDRDVTDARSHLLVNWTPLTT